MKKLYSTLILVLIICAVVIAGCSTSTLAFPPTSETVIGNGGIAAIKGDYLYYVNGYVDASLFTNIRTDNIYGKEVRGAIYKTKLKNQQVQKNEDGFLLETTVVVPQVVGFNNGGFYIIGDYLYYLTPLMEEDGKTTQLKSGFLEVCRIKLDGTGKERVYKTNNAIENVTWSVYHMDGKDVVVMLDGGNLVSITVSGKNKTTKTMATDVTKVALLQQSNYTHTKDNLKDYEQYIYYTRPAVESDNLSTHAKNLICKVKIGTNNEEIVLQHDDNEYNLATLKNGYLYYSKTVYIGGMNASPAEVFMINTKAVTQTEQKVANAGYSNNIENFAVLSEDYNASGLNVITVDANNVMRKVQANGNSSQIIYRGTSSFTIITTKNSYVYIQQDGQIYRVDANGNESQEAIQLTNSEVTYLATNKSLIDIDGSRMFIFASYEGENENTNYYLNIIENISKREVAEGDMISKFVGEFKKGECPPKPIDEECEDDECDDEHEKQPWII